jgi:3'-phosphoadenosine 5'-phosphosulfate sulfotransferase (PAPS reductase)/FAD synthetase
VTLRFEHRGQLGLFTDGFEELAVDDSVRAAVQCGSPVAFSLSGGKDSVSISFAANRLLDQLGHPADRRVAIHANLGRIEWQSTPGTVEAAAERLGVPLIIVRNKSHDMLSRWERRFELGCQRYQDLLTYHLTGPWSSASNRFCTAEMKTQVILPELLRRWPDQQIVSVVGIRRQESLKRALTPISKAEGDRYRRAAGGHILTWHPGVNLLEEEVYTFIGQHELPLPESYSLGSTRHGCAFCVLGSINDITVAARAPGNRGVLHHLVDQEAKTTFSFQPDRWLGDVAPDLLPASLASDFAKGKALGAERRRLEASLPANLRYVKGWPQRVPDINEAAKIAAVRALILATHNLTTPYPTAQAVRDRIAQLFAEQRLKEAA